MITLRRSAASLAAPLRNAKSEASQQISQLASDLRQIFIPAIAGQELTYQEKEKQALAYIAASPEPDPTNVQDMDHYGFIFGEVGVTAPSPYQVAQIILFKAQAFRSVGPKIERLRLKAYSDVMTCTTEAEIDAVVQAYERDLAELDPR